MTTKKKSIKKRPRFKRILLKLSGEAFQNPNTGKSLDSDVIHSIARQIKHVRSLGVEMAIVVGGGNIFRGLSGSSWGIERATGDQMGMLATVINSLSLQAALEDLRVETRVMTAIRMPSIAEPYIRRKAIRHLEKGRITIFGAGTGNPYFTTDSAAALRASEIGAEVLLKGTKVDGIYTEDPVKNPRAKRFKKLTFSDALRKQLKIMDAAAFSLCMENHIPIIVFNYFKKDEMKKVLQGKEVGTLVDQK